MCDRGMRQGYAIRGSPAVNSTEVSSTKVSSTNWRSFDEGLDEETTQSLGEKITQSMGEKTTQSLKKIKWSHQ